MNKATVFLIPTVLAENTNHCIPNYITEVIKTCEIFFVENEKTTRRYFKTLWKEMVIDDYKWINIHKAESSVKNQMAQAIAANKKIGIVSEAGCPCVADPGQILIDFAHENKAKVVPLVGPSSILLALMASGLNGQSFQFVGYLPIDASERKKKLKELENYSVTHNCTQIFIETPYRNNQMLKDILQTCKPQTKLCVAVDLTSDQELIISKPIATWQQTQLDIHKKPTIFLFLA
jgi:16S rRNA (cytidine1402-2'-O)-methyltransferase